MLDVSQRGLRNITARVILLSPAGMKVFERRKHYQPGAEQRAPWPPTRSMSAAPPPLPSGP